MLSLLFSILPTNITNTLSDEQTLTDALDAALDPAVANAPQNQAIMAKMWSPIVDKIKDTIDNIYGNLDVVLFGLDKESPYLETVKAQVKAGKRLLFKPNTVAPQFIRPGRSHGKGVRPERGAVTCSVVVSLVVLRRVKRRIFNKN